MTTSTPQPTGCPRPSSHRHDCACPTCLPGPRPDFTTIAARVVVRTEDHLVIASNLLPDAAEEMSARSLAVMHRRLARYQVADLVWDLPDHFTITTTRDPGVRDHTGARSRVTLRDVRDEHRCTITTLDVRLYAGLVTDGRAVTSLDHLRVDEADPDSPVLVARVRAWFAADQALLDHFA